VTGRRVTGCELGGVKGRTGVARFDLMHSQTGIRSVVIF
jgi:hypothetical protein